jgi:hypothetical protein
MIGLSYAAPSLLAPTPRLALSVAVFALVAWALTRAFRRRSGVAFKVR